MKVYLSDLKEKKILVRVDFNVPFEGGQILDDARLQNTKEIVFELQKVQAKIILLSHLRSESSITGASSLKNLIPKLEEIYAHNVIFVEDISEANSIIDIAPAGAIILIENIRKYPEEEKCDTDFAEKLATLGDFYVNEAFSVSHRRHASVVELPKFLPHAIGPAFASEINTIDSFLQLNYNSKKMCIIGGAKLSTKINLLKKLVPLVNKMALGGGIAGAFLSFLGSQALKIFEPKGYEKDVTEIIAIAKQHNCELILPVDSSALISSGEGFEHAILSTMDTGASIFDIGPESVKLFKQNISESDMVLWNGPLGLFEREPFDYGTLEIAKHMARLTKKGNLISLVGGGDTSYALKKFGLTDYMSYVSTGGGAFLTYVETETLCGLDAVERNEIVIK